MTSSSTSSLLFLIPGIWRLTFMNLMYGIAEPPVLSSSNNWPNGWICSARSLQNWEFTLDTSAPKSISAVVSCPSTITVALLECPTKWAMGSGLRKGTGVTSGHPFFCATFRMVNFHSRSVRECWGPTVGCCSWCCWGVGHIPSVPPRLV